LALGDIEGAERAFRVAVAQLPGLIPAHQALARLCDRHLGRPGEAALHRRRAAELLERADKRRAARSEPPPCSAAPTDPLPLPTRAGSRPADRAGEIVVVAGLPRSGTSMLMQLLAAGGVTPLTDGRRVADEDNPRGYFELEAATRLDRDVSWVPAARGKAVKLALPLMALLPPGESYRILVIERSLGEVIASQRAMLERLGRLQDGALDDEMLAAEYRRQRERLRLWLERRPEMAVLPLRYDAILSHPHTTAERIGVFLGGSFDVAAATAAIAPSLRRQRLGAV
jgi:hypothetical protein